MESSVVVQPSAPQQTESCPSQLLVSEMMILAGQAIARLGQLAASSGTHCLYKFIFFITASVRLSGHQHNAALPLLVFLMMILAGKAIARLVSPLLHVA